MGRLFHRLLKESVLYTQQKRILVYWTYSIDLLSSKRTNCFRMTAHTWRVEGKGGKKWVYLSRWLFEGIVYHTKSTILYALFFRVLINVYKMNRTIDFLNVPYFFYTRTHFVWFTVLFGLSYCVHFLVHAFVRLYVDLDRNLLYTFPAECVRMRESTRANVQFSIGHKTIMTTVFESQTYIRSICKLYIYRFSCRIPNVFILNFRLWLCRLKKCY